MWKIWISKLALVLDSDEDKNANKSPKEEKPQPLSVLPEVITLGSSDEERCEPSKARSPVPPQEVYEIPTEPQEVYEIPTEPIAKFKGESTLSLQEKLRNAQKLLSRDLPLPDGGERLRNQITDLEVEIARREKYPEEPEPDLIVDKVVDAMNKSLHINAYPEDRRPRSEFKIKTPWSYLTRVFSI
ncbi:unnamed protein product [Cylicostephanus goldi]|uniref:Uncharacterized protein n=1 Tax=Cylicostephanus goldi TaxID=71465 RepID=A0A3P7NE74_CYLGO|nr:unnamed protein product [Cylicostephanus goldi]